MLCFGEVASRFSSHPHSAVSAASISLVLLCTLALPLTFFVAALSLAVKFSFFVQLTSVAAACVCASSLVVFVCSSFATLYPFGLADSRVAG